MPSTSNAHPNMPGGAPFAGGRFNGIVEFGPVTTVGELLAAQANGTMDDEPRVVAGRMINPTPEDILKHAQATFEKRKTSGTASTAAIPMNISVDGKFAPPIDACGRCGKKGKEGEEGLKRCMGCKKMLYCGKDCQKKDWKEHKVKCKLN